MTEFRSRLLQLKQYDSSLIATSRKRKLRELYAVADCDGPIPLNWVVNDIDHPPPPPTPSAAEALFLEQNDILQRRILDESSIPTRRQLRSYSAKGNASARRGLESQALDASRLSARASREDGVRKSRGATPAKEAGVKPTNISTNGVDSQYRSRSATSFVDVTSERAPRASSKGSQTETPPPSGSTAYADMDETMADAPPSAQTTGPSVQEPGPLEEERIRNEVESRPGSPGVDPRQAVPMSAEDIAQLSEPIIIGSQDDHHKAATVHLPPREVQEGRLRQIDQRIAGSLSGREKDTTEILSIKLPPPRNARPLGDPPSSPGSTIEANSATTPALHEASTDTSPENEGPRYEVDKGEGKETEPQTPPELAPSKEEVLEKEEHDRLLKAHIELARSEILASSPAEVDAQLRLEEEQAAAASSNDPDREVADSEKSGIESNQDVSIADSEEYPPESKALTQTAGEAVQDILDDEDDEVVGVPTPEDEKVTDPETNAKVTSLTEPVIDVNKMDVDSPMAEREVRNAEPEDKILGTSEVSMVQDTLSTAEKPVASIKDLSSNNISTAIPRRIPLVPAPTAPTLERMTTRVSSGAMRHKSVSEILGEIPRPNSIVTSERPTVAKAPADMDSVTESNSQSRASTPQSPASRMRTMIERAKEKERSKLSTVVFAKQPSDRLSNKSNSMPSSSKAQDEQSADYFMPLILHQAYSSTRGMQPLEQLLMAAHKTITTSNAYVTFHEHQSYKVLRRIHALQTQDKWCFRQPKRSPEPNRPTAHWDELLKEARWMRTDFREERKWKMAVARNLATACAEWIEADEDDRKLLQVKAILPPKEPVETLSSDETEGVVLPSAMEVSHPTPELIASAENDSPIEEFDEEPRTSLLDAVPPHAMFTLNDDDVVFGLRRSPATDKILEKLPMYGAPLKIPQSDLPTSDVDPDASWKKAALPLSKYIESKIVLKDEGPPRKRSRYEYEQEDDDEDDEQVILGDQESKRVPLEPSLLDVALFNPENKHIRDRIHAGHQFRPPSENPMPLQSFFECRSSSQWTRAEDDELKGLVREYSYNWQLISSMLSTRSMFASSAERRTPWECFERWILLEGLPADMQKTHYFRAYNNRLEAARGTLLAQAAQPPPQANAAGAAITPVRRRTTTSVSVERRRNQKHLTLVDAMRKLAKKRETSLQKQQHAASLAAMRKANEVAQPPAARHTPQDFSRLKHDRELQLLERVQRHQMQQEAARRQALQQGRNAQQPNAQQYPNGSSQQPRVPPNANAVSSVNLPLNVSRANQLAVPGQNLPHAQMQTLPNGLGAQASMTNGHGPISQMPLKGVPQAQMQGMQGMPGMPGMPGMQGIPSQHRMPAPNPAPDLRLVMQARQISEQQRQAVQMQQQGQNGQIQNSPPNMRTSMNGINQQAFMQNNQAMIAAFNAGNMNGVSTPPANGLNMPSAGSPRMGHPNQSQQPNSSVTQITKLEAQYRAQFPSASPEQVNKFVRDALSQNIAQHRQSAMHAAAGNGMALAGMPGGMQNSPQQYAQMLRAQQEKQAASVSQQGRSASAGSSSSMGK